MTLRLVLRSLATRPVRSAVLACGFGLGIAVMAALLGVGEVVLEQARSPALAGGGDVFVRGTPGELTSARYVLTTVLGKPSVAGRISGASPTRTAMLYLLREGGVVPVAARGGIPSMERALGDPETASVAGWNDAPGDAAWTSPDPGDVLRAMDRFHPIPDVPEFAGSWAEWLYFNGHAGDTRFYLTFMVGPRLGPERRRAGVRLQLDRGGMSSSYSEPAEISESELLATAPDLRIGRSRVQLDGQSYRITLNLDRDNDDSAAARWEDRSTPAPAADLTGELTLEVPSGMSIPPVTVHGARGWLSGYVVPVLSGPVSGTLNVGGEVISLGGGTGYHDHNWGFWEGVSWQWGQVAGDDLALLYGRIRPPAGLVDPDRLPGVLAALGPQGLLDYSTWVTIDEVEDPDGARPRSIRVRGRGAKMDLTMDLAVQDVIRTRMAGGPSWPEGEAVDFFQMRGIYRVTGRVGGREVDFTAPGAAETFRGRGGSPLMSGEQSAEL